MCSDLFVGGVILARLDSSRLPGKQLKKIRDKYLLDWLLERARNIAGIDELILATTDRAIDDPLEEFAANNNLSCFRGSAHDVAKRVRDCITERKYDAWVRVNGDSPLIDYKLIDYGISLFKKYKSDIVTNTLERTYPIGNSVEVVNADVFKDGYKRMYKPSHFEHVTAFFYEHDNEYNIKNFKHSAGNFKNISLAVDCPDDLRRYQWMLDQVEGNSMALVGDKAIELASKYKSFVDS